MSRSPTARRRRPRAADAAIHRGSESGCPASRSIGDGPGEVAAGGGLEMRGQHRRAVDLGRFEEPASKFYHARSPFRAAQMRKFRAQLPRIFIERLWSISQRRKVEIEHPEACLLAESRLRAGCGRIRMIGQMIAGGRNGSRYPVAIFLRDSRVRAVPQPDSSRASLVVVAMNVIDAVVIRDSAGQQPGRARPGQSCLGRIESMAPPQGLEMPQTVVDASGPAHLGEQSVLGGIAEGNMLEEVLEFSPTHVFCHLSPPEMRPRSSSD